jgi:hypothetical protein
MGGRAARTNLANRMWEGLHHDLVSTAEAIGHMSTATMIGYIQANRRAIDALIRSF